MTLFTVTWRRTADARLAELWLNAPDQNAVTAAANAIDRALRIDPHGRGEWLTDDLFQWSNPPLVVIE
jgi:hypothetical protein